MKKAADISGKPLESRTYLSTASKVPRGNRTPASKTPLLASFLGAVPGSNHRVAQRLHTEWIEKRPPPTFVVTAAWYFIPFEMRLAELEPRLVKH